MAKSVIAAGLCKRALVQLSYAIGVAQPLSLFVETYGTEREGLTAQAITDIIKLEFDCRPGALARNLPLQAGAGQLRQGRQEILLVGGPGGPVQVRLQASMTADAVAGAVAANKEAILAKWVD